MKQREILSFSDRGRQHLINELCTIYQPLFVARYLSEDAIAEYLAYAKNAYSTMCTIQGAFENSAKPVYFDEDDFEWSLDLTNAKEDAE
jgi:hypothetical protein